jgi:hypothetical protein
MAAPDSGVLFAEEEVLRHRTCARKFSSLKTRYVGRTMPRRGNYRKYQGGPRHMLRLAPVEKRGERSQQA